MVETEGVTVFPMLVTTSGADRVLVPLSVGAAVAASVGASTKVPILPAVVAEEGSLDGLLVLAIDEPAVPAAPLIRVVGVSCVVVLAVRTDSCSVVEAGCIVGAFAGVEGCVISFFSPASVPPAVVADGVTALVLPPD